MLWITDRGTTHLSHYRCLSATQVWPSYFGANHDNKFIYQIFSNIQKFVILNKFRPSLQPEKNSCTKVRHFPTPIGFIYIYPETIYAPSDNIQDLNFFVAIYILSATLHGLSLLFKLIYTYKKTSGWLDATNHWDAHPDKERWTC